jgi:hypothetical protein
MRRAELEHLCLSGRRAQMSLMGLWGGGAKPSAGKRAGPSGCLTACIPTETARVAPADTTN